MNGQPQLRLTFDDGLMGSVTMVITLEDQVASLMHIEPPRHSSFDHTVQVLKQKQYRKDLFIRECARLGELLADRMEDAEGWHDTSRMNPAKAQLKR